MNSCIDPRMCRDIKISQLKKQKRLLKLKKLFGKATQEEIDKVEREILKVQEEYKALFKSGIMF